MKKIMAVLAMVGAFIVGLLMSIFGNAINTNRTIKKQTKLKKKYDEIDSKEDLRSDDDVLRGG